MQCPCQSGQPAAECCQPFLEGEAWPDTAEQLMRARYTAFATGAVDFIIESHDPSSRDEVDRNTTAQWSKQSEWLGFELLDVEGGQKSDTDGRVEFVARYKVKGDEVAHHETAVFHKKDGRWYFVDSEMAGHETFVRQSPKVGRNDPCPCGSGKKYKKCCARVA
ncbi:MAG: YchJ family protein [Planctomycetes bacterium]|nr:YchJ family protein [Planctomycetota bacterium]